MVSGLLKSQARPLIQTQCAKPFCAKQVRSPILGTRFVTTSHYSQIHLLSRASSSEANDVYNAWVFHQAFRASMRPSLGGEIRLNFAQTAAERRLEIESERGLTFVTETTLSITPESRSTGSLFITYSSTNHRRAAGISEYADSKIIGTVGKRCLS
jgi:hypothetical protein